MRSTLFVRRARGPLRTHSSSCFRNFCRLRSLLLLGRLALPPWRAGNRCSCPVGDEAAARQLDDARGDAIEEIAVVRDEEARAGVAREEVLEPLDALGVEMVGRLVEDEEIRPREQRAAERDAPLFAAAERADDAGRGRARGDWSARLSMRWSRFQPS